MSNKKRRNRQVPKVIEPLDLSGSQLSDDPIITAVTENDSRRSIIGSLTSYISSHRIAIGIIGLGLLLGLGVFAKNGWLPSTDALTGKKTGWFGKELPHNASSSWNPLAAPFTTPTPQLSKEYIYAGSRLLAVEDANASAAPPADIAVWRPSSGAWYVLGGPGSAPTSYNWGMSGDIPTQGDFDGDGKTDFAVYRPSGGIWYIVKSSDGTVQYGYWGVSTDKPAVADYDGDGRSDIAVWRPSDGNWYILYSSGGGNQFQWGTSGDTPVPADYDGDGRADVSVWRSSDHAFYTLLSSTGGFSSTNFGSTGDVPVCGDYDGDGKANYALKSGANWIIMNAAGTVNTPISWGQSGDIPVQNDYDGDGKVDIAVWRSAPSAAPWLIRQSSHIGQTNELRTEYWGMTADIPVPAFYRR